MDRTRNCDVRITDESLSLLIGLSSASLSLQLARTHFAEAPPSQPVTLTN